MIDNFWETVAEQWTAWARTSGHDAFWSYRNELCEFLPPPGRHTLDLGCGEGRISRLLTELGHRVTACDSSPSLLAAARNAGSAAHYQLADAAALPFADGEFDRVIAYNMLMDVPDMPASVAEAARVLAPHGVLTLSVVHPFADAGRFAGDNFVVSRDYFATTRMDETVRRDGLTMRFHGWCHPLRAYTTALRRAGLVITELWEPQPEAVPDANSDMARWRRMPMFLWINTERR